MLKNERRINMANNSFAVKDGKIYLNGQELKKVTYLEIKCKGHLYEVSLSFDVPTKDTTVELPRERS